MAESLSAEDLSTVPEWRIVVGVDGSRASTHALDWAVQAARLTGGHIDVVHAAKAPSQVRLHGYAKSFHEAARKVLDDAIAEVKTLDANVSVSGAIASSRPAEALLRASRGAEFLVVGARGRGGFRGLGLGSVGEQCANNAHCTVIIVRGEHNAMPPRRRRGVVSDGG